MNIEPGVWNAATGLHSVKKLSQDSLLINFRNAATVLVTKMHGVAALEHFFSP
jgi:hypothetical protein